MYFVNGVKTHPRSVGAKYGTRSLEVLRSKGLNVVLADSEEKHRYLMPMDDEMRKRIVPLAQLYPKRVKKQESENPSDLGGAVPTDTLHE
jgi:hypothetical protein